MTRIPSLWAMADAIAHYPTPAGVAWPGPRRMPGVIPMPARHGPRFLRGMALTASTTTGIAGAVRAAKEPAESQVPEALPTSAAVARAGGRAAGSAMETS